jgi:hypothetical protein
LKVRARHLFTRSPRFAKLQRIDPGAPSHGFRKLTAQLPRKHASILIQLRSGNVPLNCHLHKIGKVVSFLCPACGEREETVHFLFICSAYNRQRHILRQTVGRGGAQADVLLNDPKALPALFHFIHDSARFQDTFGDLDTPAGRT